LAAPHQYTLDPSGTIIFGSVILFMILQQLNKILVHQSNSFRFSSSKKSILAKQRKKKDLTGDGQAAQASGAQNLL
jgi:hypothetical protein